MLRGKGYLGRLPRGEDNAKDFKYSDSMKRF